MANTAPSVVDYADSRNLRGDDARVERLGRQQGLTGESSLLPSKSKSGLIESRGYDKIATTQEKKAAGPGAGGKSDKCNKGKSCGAACIYYEKDCILELPETVNQAINDVRSMLERRVSAGLITEEEAAGYMQRMVQKSDKEPDTIVGISEKRGKEIYEALKDIRNSHTKDGTTDEKKVDRDIDRVMSVIVSGTATPRTKNTPLTVEDFEGMQANRATWTALSDLQKEVIARRKSGDPMSPEELQSKLRPIVEPFREPVSDAQVKLAKALMPEQERAYFATAGALNEKDTGGRFGANAKGDALPVSYGPLKSQTAQEANNRLDLLTRVYLEFNGRDLVTGRRIPITLSDLEHNIAENHAGRAAEQGLNYSPLKTSLNVGRGNKDHVAYYGGLLAKMEFDSNGKLTSASREKVQRALDKAASVSGIKGQVVSAARAAQTASDLRGIMAKIEAVPNEKLQAKLYNKLVAEFLSAYAGAKVAETARAGIQSHGRGEQPWYWYGDWSGGGAIARRIARKMENLLEDGRVGEAMQLAQIMRNASAFIKTYVNENVSPNTERDGKPAIIMGGEKTRETTQAIIAARELIINQIEAL